MPLILLTAFMTPTEDGGVDEIHVVYTHFRSMVSQEARIRRILPLEVVDQVGWGPVDPDGRLNIESILESQRQLVEWGTIGQALPAERLVEPQFWEYAVQQLGPYRG